LSFQGASDARACPGGRLAPARHTQKKKKNFPHLADNLLEEGPEPLGVVDAEGYEKRDKQQPHLSAARVRKTSRNKDSRARNTRAVVAAQSQQPTTHLFCLCLSFEGRNVVCRL
jgi:hypothetical protein